MSGLSTERVIRRSGGGAGAGGICLGLARGHPSA